MTALLLAAALLTIVGLALGWAGRKPLGWTLWTVGVAADLVYDVLAGHAWGWVLLDTVCLLSGCAYLASLYLTARKARP